jgi:hypothetical protein
MDFFFSINLMSVHNSAKFQHCGVIFVKSPVDTKNRLFFRYRALFFADTVLPVGGGDQGTQHQ